MIRHNRRLKGGDTGWLLLGCIFKLRSLTHSHGVVPRSYLPEEEKYQRNETAIHFDLSCFYAYMMMVMMMMTMMMMIAATRNPPIIMIIRILSYIIHNNITL